MDKHLCGCLECPLWAAVTEAVADAREKERYLKEDSFHVWVFAQADAEDARSDWLDHVLQHQNRHSVAQAA